LQLQRRKPDCDTTESFSAPVSVENLVRPAEAPPQIASNRRETQTLTHTAPPPP
jgi:hypothetical protein